VKLRIEPERATEPTLALVPLATCEAGAAAGAERAVVVRMLGKSGTWMGLADLRSLDAACARIEARVDGVAVGSAQIALRP
jgi:hypothetical protein